MYSPGYEVPPILNTTMGRWSAPDFIPGACSPRTAQSAKIVPLASLPFADAYSWSPGLLVIHQIDLLLSIAWLTCSALPVRDAPGKSERAFTPSLAQCFLLQAKLSLKDIGSKTKTNGPMCQLAPSIPYALPSTLPTQHVSQQASTKLNFNNPHRAFSMQPRWPEEPVVQKYTHLYRPAAAALVINL